MTTCKGVKDFATFLGRSPNTAKSEDVRGFRLHLASSSAGIVLKDTRIASPKTESDLIAFCRTKLIKWLYPREIEFLPNLPKTHIGKVDYRALSARVPGTGGEDRGRFVADVDHTKARLIRHSCSRIHLCFLLRRRRPGGGTPMPSLRDDPSDGVESRSWRSGLPVRGRGAEQAVDLRIDLDAVRPICQATLLFHLCQKCSRQALHRFT